MDLTLTDDFVRTLATRAKTDEKLLDALAAAYLGQVEPLAMARFLLTPDIALALLAERIKVDPAGTIERLARLPRRHKARRTGRAAVAKAVAKRLPAKRQPRKGKRTRLSASELQVLKDAVLSFLGNHAPATRKEISAAARIPTPSIYNRVMSQLLEAGEVVAEGQKANRVYALR